MGSVQREGSTIQQCQYDQCIKYIYMYIYTHTSYIYIYIHTLYIYIYLCIFIYTYTLYIYIHMHIIYTCFRRNCVVLCLAVCSSSQYPSSSQRAVDAAFLWQGAVRFAVWEFARGWESKNFRSELWVPTLVNSHARNSQIMASPVPRLTGQTGKARGLRRSTRRAMPSQSAGRRVAPQGSIGCPSLQLCPDLETKTFVEEL